MVDIKELKKLLIEEGYLKGAKFDELVAESVSRSVEPEVILVEKGIIPDQHLGQLIANRFGWRYIDLFKNKISDELLALIPFEVAKAQKAIVFEHQDNVLKLATTNPDNYEFFRLLEKTASLEVEPYYATPFAMEDAFRFYKKDFTKQLDEVIAAIKAGNKTEDNIVRFVDYLLEYANDNRASDIHLEPMDKQVAVRYRVDGSLQEVFGYPKELHEKVAFRLKIMAKLRTDEHQAAQDGRFSYHKKDAQFDVRLSILPITEGENIVMRLLAEHSRRFNLEDLGLDTDDMDKVRRAAEKPYGMILAVGPTGSGKTTSLYALLQIVNQPDVNIMTIEDPVEYQMEHVQQTQVNAKKNLTFATGLRSLVRQDPDIIMVGEIRDAETASIAVNIAMTGHLLLSTLHANNAGTTFPRLFDMGLEPFLVASSANVVVAQRLVRKICDRCKASVALDKKVQVLLSADKNLAAALASVSKRKDFSKLTVYQGAGCSSCGNTGYAGRTGIFEVMEINDEIRQLINQKASADIIEKAAVKAGMRTMQQDGLKKALAGVTTIEEVFRSTKT
ncbi:MAG: GspE/PulE family protein [Candidatus Falkowbacteria bacterium]